MKANAPEKIYLQPITIEQLPHQNIVYTKPLADNSIEYTRTDAFIEKTCEFLKSYRQEIDGGKGYIAGIVNDETIEDFKKYMKGE